MSAAIPVANLWAEDFKIRSGEVDLRRQATPETVGRILQEAAWNHAEALGWGYGHLGAQNKLWVLSRLRIEVERYPRWGEAGVVRTWPTPTQSVFAMRHFEMSDSHGTRLLVAATAWLILDAVTRKPQRADRLLSSRPIAYGLPAGPDPSALADCGSAGEAVLPITVRHSDLDVNGHVNYARYLGWLLDAYSLEFHRVHLPLLFEVNYLAETLCGESLVLSRQEVAAHRCVHSIRKSTGGPEVCRALIQWKPCPEKSTG